MGSTEQPSSWTVPFDGLGSFPLVQGSKGQIGALQLPNPVNVHEVGAMSSAANGAVGAPGIKGGSTPAAQFCDNFPCPHVKNANFDNSKIANVAEGAICSDASQGAHCSFPSV